MYTVVFLPKAQTEYEEAVLWYVERSPKMANVFIHTVDEAINHIKSYPLAFDAHHLDYRECVLLIFPYSIIYFLKNEEIVITGLFHHKRDPAAKFK